MRACVRECVSANASDAASSPGWNRLAVAIIFRKLEIHLQTQTTIGRKKTEERLLVVVKQEKGMALAKDAKGTRAVSYTHLRAHETDSYL
eukprot:2871326-Pleurochrysis_carterae.AAC.1